MCGCNCSSYVDYEPNYGVLNKDEIEDLYEFSKIDDEELYRTYCYDVKNDRIILKGRFGEYFRSEFIQTRNSVHDGFCNTHILLKAKTGKILIYNHYDLKLKLRELYRQSVRNQIREEIRNELSSSEPLLSI